MIFSPSLNVIFITTLVDYPRTCLPPRIMSLGLRPISYSLNSIPEIIGPHNSPSKSCFAASQKERKILISSSPLPCDFVSFSQVLKTPFYLLKACLWRFSTQGAPLFNFGDFLVPHVQWQDGNLTVKRFSWYTSGNLSFTISMPL